MPFHIPEMKEESVHTFEQERVFYQLLEAIEAVRIRRQEEYREKRHPQLKRFTQEELTDEACSTYKNWLVGRSHRLPSYSMLMQIADYLECSLRERNDLLLAAHYLPIQPEWEGEELRQALEQAQQIMEKLPYPAIVVTHTLEVRAANALFLHLLELPPLETLPPHQRNTMYFLFHPNICGQARSTSNTEAHTLWQQHVMYALQLFQRQNVLSQHEVWYQQLVKLWCDEIPDFQAYWEKAREASRQEDAPTKLTFARIAATGEMLPIRVRQMLVSASSRIYPAVSAFLPVDEAARTVYASLGCMTS